MPYVLILVVLKQPFEISSENVFKQEKQGHGSRVESRVNVNQLAKNRALGVNSDVILLHKLYMSSSRTQFFILLSYFFALT